ncbi:MAG: IgGFc-binding protein [Calditrichota bacterium]
MTNFKQNLVLLCFLLFGMTGSLFAQSLDNKGNEFYMAFLRDFDTQSDIQVHLTSDVATNVLLEFPANAPTFTTTVTVSPGAITIVDIPYNPSSELVAGIVENKLIRASSTEEFVAYMISVRNFSSDAALALPVDTYNTQYIAMSYFSNIVFQDRSEFAVVAAFDNTTVTITPTANLVGGFAANVPFQVVLNRGEMFLAQGLANGQANDLTGSLIDSDKPIGMTNGNLCTNVPPSVAACDHIFEVAQPTQTWGNRALVIDFPHTPNGVVYRIMAAEDNTTLLQNGSTIEPHKLVYLKKTH